MLPKDLTPEEQLVIKQRRLGLTQQGMAEVLGVSYAKYRCWTRGQFAKNDSLPDLELGARLYLTEVIFITRRRNKVKQWQIARDLGVTIPLVAMMEKGKVPCERLLRYWGIKTDGRKHIRTKTR